MFKDAFLDDHAESRRPWTVAVSLLAQCLAVSIAILIPLLTAVDLPARQWMAHLLAPPPLPPVAAPAPPAAAPHQQRFDESTMVAPAVIPDQVAVLVDPPDAPNSSGNGIAGVVAVPGTVPGGVPGGVLSELIAVKEPLPPVALPKAREVQPKKPVPIGGAVQAAMIVHRVDPLYPALARQARVSGLVKLEAIIGEDGAIRELRVISGHPLLLRSAIEAVKQWRYRPTLLNKTPVAVITQIDVNFRLGG